MLQGHKNPWPFNWVGATIRALLRGDLGIMQKISDNWLNKAAGFSAAATAFALPISITALSFLYPLAVFFSILNYRNWRVQPNWWRHPVVIVTALYFLLYVIGMTYSVGDWHDRLKDFQKHLWIFGTILLMPVFIEKKWRDYAINAFLAAMTLILILSFCKFYGLFHWRPELGQSAMFNNYIVQSILMAFAAVLFLQRYLSQPKKNWALLAITLAMIINIFFFSEGRSGYITFALLFCYLLYDRYRIKGLIPALLIIIMLGGLAYFLSPTLHHRINLMFTETTQNHYLNYETSMGRRYAEGQNSWNLIKQAPWIGYGTGGVREAYHALPHELFQRAVLVDQVDLDYMNILMKFGFIGLAIVLLFFFVLWYEARSLEDRERYIGRALVLFFLFGCIANDIMNTVVTGHLLSIFVALAFAPLIGTKKAR
jgi:O-antigen ligase